MTKKVGTKDIKRGKKRGLTPSKRPVTSGKTQANQWHSTPQQNQFMENWLNVRSETFGNAYRSAIKAGYSHNYALLLASPSVNNKWLLEYHNRGNLSLDHIQAVLEGLALADNTRPSDKIKALELIAKLKGLLIERKEIATVKIELGKGNAVIDND